jgi:WD40 repeat protein/tetratricopeptide (TPR) repeat protein
MVVAADRQDTFKVAFMIPVDVLVSIWSVLQELSSEFVFISYAQRDLQLVTQLRTDLQKQGVTVWTDQAGLQPGTHDWEEALRQAIRSARAVLLVASPNAQQSRYVKDELRIAEMYKRRIYPIWVTGEEWMASIPLGWGSVQAIDARGDRYVQAVVEISQLLGGGEPVTRSLPELLEPAPAPDFVPRNPYKGLRAFTGADIGDFFGREKLVGELLNTLRQIVTTPGQNARLLAIVGASGSGKSSLVMAGLLPQLQAGAIPGSSEWFYLERFVPGGDPIENLALIWSQVLGRSIRTIREDLEDPNTRGLHVLGLQLAKAANSKVVLFIDQFEEIFTQTTNEDSRRQFINLLTMACTMPDGPLIVILTLRADFYDRPIEYADFGRLLKERHEVVYPMEVRDLRAVIEKPAALPDVQLEFEGNLVGDLLFELRNEASALPLLQFTLDQLFERRQGNLLTSEAYREIGGVKGALAQHAEKTFADLPSDEHRHLARALFLRLVEAGASEQDATRRRAAVNELDLLDSAQAEILRQVGQAFIGARLLTIDKNTVEISHEALIREWALLGDWLHAAREDMRLTKAISGDAAEWIRRGRPASGDMLYRGTQLEEALAWAQRNPASVNEMAFVEASLALQERRAAEEGARRAREEQTARRARQFGRTAAAAAIIGVLAVVATIFAVQTANEAVQRSAKAEIDIATATAQLQLAGAQIQHAQTTATAASQSVATATAALVVAETRNAAAQATATRALVAADQSNATATSAAAAAEQSNLAATAAGQSVATATAALVVAETRSAIAQATAASAADAAATALARESQARATTIAVATEVVMAQFELQQKRTESRAVELAAKAQEFQNRSLWVALPLAVAANRVDGASQVARDTLANIVYNANILNRFDAHAGFVNEVAVSPDGHTVLSAGSDYRVITWDAQTGVQRSVWHGHHGAVTTVAFLPDGKRALSGSWDKTLILWDVESGQPIKRLEAHVAPVTALGISPDGRRAISASCRRESYASCKEGQFIIWNLERQRPLHSFEGHHDRINDVIFSPDGNTVLSTSEDRSLRLWDAAIGREQRVLLDDDYEYISAAAFHPDGKTIAFNIDNAGTIVLWDLETWGETRRLRGHTGWSSNLKFSADGKYLLSAGVDMKILLWEVASGDLIHKYEQGHDGAVTSVAFAPDGRSFVSGAHDSTVIRWSIDPVVIQQRLSGHREGVWAVAVRSDGRVALSGSADDQMIAWDLQTGAVRQTFQQHTDRIWDVAFSPDGYQALSGSSDKTMILWDVETGEQLDTVEHKAEVFAVAFGRDGRIALSSARDRTFTLWKITPNWRMDPVGQELRGHLGAVRDIAVATQSDRALSAGEDGFIILWDLTARQPISTFVGHEAAVTSVDFSPDEHTALSGGYDGSLILWDLTTGKEIRRFSKSHRAEVSKVVFSPDGTRALSSSADASVILWDVATGEPIQTFPWHTASVRDVVFLPDGRHALSGSVDRTLVLWQLLDEQPDALQQWAQANIHFPQLSCLDRQQFRVEPECTADQYLAEGVALLDRFKIAAAIQAFDYAIDLAPERAAGYRQRGLANLNNNVAQAVRDFERALQIEPDVVETLNGRGKAYHLLGDFSAAIADYDQALELDGKNAESYRLRGWAYCAQGMQRPDFASARVDYEQALADFNQAETLAPELAQRPSVNNFFNLYHGRGWTQHSLGHFKEAIEDFDRAINLGLGVLDMADAYFGRGQANYQTGLATLNKNALRRAHDDFERLLELNPTHRDGYIWRAWASVQLGELEQALTEFRPALDANPQSGPAYQGRGQAYFQQGDFEEALSAFEQAIELSPQDGSLYFWRGWTRYWLNEPGWAIRDFDRALALGVTIPDLYLGRGQAHLRLDELAQARADFDAVIEQNPDGYPDAYAGRGQVYYQQGLYTQAVLEYDQAIQREGNNAFHFSARAEVYFQLGDYLRAIGDLTQALDLQPQNAEFYRFRGMAHLMAGEDGKAHEDFSTSIRMQPVNPLSYLWRGLVNLRLGKLDAAQQDMVRSGAQDDTPTGQVISLLWGSVIQTLQGAPDEAADALEQAMVVAEAIDDESLQMRVFALITLVKGDAGAARTYYQKALDTSPFPYQWTAPHRIYLPLLEEVFPDRTEITELRQWFEAAIAVDQR